MGLGGEAAFWILAVVSVAAALSVVLLRDVFRAALFLILCFFGVAGIYATLDADFLAVAQVLVYVGAVGILVIFAIMFTRDTQSGSPFNKQHIFALCVAGILCGVMIYAMVETDWSATLGDITNPDVVKPLADLEASGEGLTGSIGQALFSENGYILPLEVSGVMLLAAVLGGIVIMRRK